jgi:hypothetical protein
VIRVDDGPRERVRVIGTLLGEQLQMLLEAVQGSYVALDLAGVNETDLDAVRLLARLPDEQCRTLACPKWLALWIEQERQPLHQAEIRA